MTSVRLRHVAEVNPPTPEFDRLDDGDEITFLPLEAIWPGTGLDTTRLRPKHEVATGYTRFRRGDILIPKITPTFQADRSVIVAGLLARVGAGTTELHVVRAGPAVERRYLRYSLASRPFLAEGEASMVGVAGQKRVPDEYLRNHRVVLRPLQDQATIADHLDAETARIDATIRLRRLLLEALAERQAVDLSRMLFGRIDGVAVTERQPLGPMPADWRVKRLRHCVEIGVGVVVNPSTYFVDEGIPFIHGSDVRDGWIDTSHLKYLSARSNESLSKSRLTSGDVVVVRAGYPGRAAVIPPELNGANCASILILRRGTELRPAYLAHFLNSLEGRTQVALAQYGAAQEQINVSDIIDFVAPVPPLAVQDEIVAQIDESVARYRRLQEIARQQIDLLIERREALITAAVTGQLAIPGVAA